MDFTCKRQMDKRGAGFPFYPLTLRFARICDARYSIFLALDIRPAGAGFLENAGWNYCVFTKTLV
jgi:hypothetical protein